MKKVLVLGDLIIDYYRWFEATRLCPEGPVPVLTPFKLPEEREGGAGLVAAQLRELIGKENVLVTYGSVSTKERIFADEHLVVRLDFDSTHVREPFGFESQIQRTIKKHRDELGAIVISDYGKGSFTEPMVERIMKGAKVIKVPVFVDAKHHWNWYEGAFAFFPNEKELKYDPKILKMKSHVVRKLGRRGCDVDGILISQNHRHAVRDVTGAGDVFLAAFVHFWLLWKNLSSEKLALEIAAGFANKVAGKSVEYTGAHVVKKEELGG